MSLSLAVLLAAVPPELDRVVGAFTDALVRHDRIAARGRRPLRQSLGTSYDRLLLYDDIRIDSWRIVSTEPGDSEAEMFLNVEMDGTATVVSTGERVRWPRWWSIQVVRLDGKWVLDTALMTERRLAERYWNRGPDELRCVLAVHPELDFHDFMYFVLAHADDSGKRADWRPTYSWIAEEAEARGELAVKSLALGLLASSAASPAEALALAEQGLRAAQASGNAEAIGWSYHDISRAHSAAGRIDDAVAALRSAASYYDRAFDARVATHALNTASEMEIARNNLRAALADAELYQTIIRKHSSPNDRIIAAFRIAEIHDRLGNTEIAHRAYVQAREIARTEGPRGILDETRWLYRILRDRALIVPSQTDLAALRLEFGDVEGCEEALDEALAVIAENKEPTPGAADVYVQRSRLRLVQGRPDEALADARKAREQAGSSLADALTAEGRALRALSQEAEAEEVLRAAIDLVDRQLRELDLHQRPAAARC